MTEQDWTKLEVTQARKELYRMYDEAMAWIPPTGAGMPPVATQGRQVIDKMLAQVRQQRQKQQTEQVQ